MLSSKVDWGGFYYYRYTRTVFKNIGWWEFGLLFFLSFFLEFELVLNTRPVHVVNLITVNMESLAKMRSEAVELHKW